MPSYLPWFLVAVFALVSGGSFLGFLVAAPILMSWFLAALSVSILLFGMVVWRSLNGWQIIQSVIFFLFLFALSYLASTRVYLARHEPRQLPQIIRSEAGPADGHTAVLYYTHGEPPAYSAWPWIETFHEIDADNASFVPWPFRPFFLSGVRSYYLNSGGSAHNKVHQIMFHSLIFSMPQALQSNVRFYLAFLDSPPRPDEMAIQAMNDGASKLIVMPVFLTDSSHTIAGKEQVESVEPGKYGVEVCYAKPLWESESLQHMFVARTDAHLDGAEKARVGILLVGHGQPDDWDAIYPTQTEQENEFRLRVRQRLIDAGYREENIALAWMSFKDPDVTQGVQALLEQGVERIYYFSTSISADAIHSDIQVPQEVESAGADSGIPLVNLGAWGNSPLVIDAIRQSILECDPSLAAPLAAER